MLTLSLVEIKIPISVEEQKYKSDIRGRVQDRNVNIKMEPMYALTYYEKMSDVKRAVHYYKYIDDLNRAGVFMNKPETSNFVPLGQLHFSSTSKLP